MQQSFDEIKFHKSFKCRRRQEKDVVNDDRIDSDVPNSASI
jgi:hypothetical protein